MILLSTGGSMEIWKDIVGYESMYQVSNKGRVKGLTRSILCQGSTHTRKERILKHGVSKTGYHRVVLCISGNNKNISVHRLVAMAFCLERIGAGDVNHLDGDKSNNHSINLEWCTPKENKEHAKRLGLIATGLSCGRAKLSTGAKCLIKDLYRYNKVAGNVRVEMPFPITWIASCYKVSPQAIYRIVKQDN